MEIRLKERAQFRKFFGNASAHRLSECIIFQIPNDLGHARFGITMKARGSSVERNAVKRVVREFFRRSIKHLGSLDYNVVIPASKRMAHPYAARLAQDLERFRRDQQSRLSVC